MGAGRVVFCLPDVSPRVVELGDGRRAYVARSKLVEDLLFPFSDWDGLPFSFVRVVAGSDVLFYLFFLKYSVLKVPLLGEPVGLQFPLLLDVSDFAFDDLRREREALEELVGTYRQQREALSDIAWAVLFDVVRGVLRKRPPRFSRKEELDRLLREVVSENFERFRQVFESIYPKVMVCYSVKTNNNLAVCKILRENGAYAEVSSLLDFQAALKAGFTGKRIIYDGPFKPVKALQDAVKNEVLLINCESLEEIKRLNAVAADFGVNQAIGLRVNSFRRPRFLGDLHPKTLVEEASFCFPRCRFGFSMEEVQVAFEYVKKMKNLRLECLMTHPYHGAVEVLMPLFKMNMRGIPVDMTRLNKVQGEYKEMIKQYSESISNETGYHIVTSALDQKKYDKESGLLPLSE